MTRQLETLSPEAHGTLKFEAWKGKKPHFVQIVASEFAAAAVACPIFITKSMETGQFYAGAMFGFKQGEDLTIMPGDEAGSFLPLDLQRQGFFVSGDDIAIEPTNPRFQTDHGEPLFDESRNVSGALRRMFRILSLMQTGIAETDTFIAALLQAKILEPIDISLRFDDGEKLVLEGLYTASLDALGDLDDATALRLFREGHLQLAYAMIGSLKQVPVLAQRRNRRLVEVA
jgi:hypothetical protein